MNIDRVLPGDAPLPTREEAQELVLSIMAQLREEAGPLYADLLRYFLLEELDRGWKEHLRNMDFLARRHRPARLRPARSQAGVQA